MSINITDLVKTQSDNNAAMVEKLPKVYEAGRLNPMDSVKKEVSGESIRVDDVSNVEHSVACNVSSKNLFDFSKINGLNTGEYGTTSNWGYDMKIDSDGNDILVTSSTGNFFYVMFAGLEFKTGQTYTVSLAEEPPHDNGNWGWYCRYIDNEYYDNTNANGSGKINFTFTPIKEVKYIGFRISTGFEYDNPVRLAKPQLELGSTVTAYTPYVSDFSSVNVSRYGKNLFEFKQGVIGNGTIIEKLENGAIVQGNYVEGNNNSWTNGWYVFDKSTVSLKAGDIVTLSCDYTVLELNENRTMADFSSDYPVRKVGLYLCSSVSNHYLYPTNQPKTLGEPVRMYVTATITDDGDYHPTMTVNSNKVRIENIQIEVGSQPTDFEEYKEKQIATANANGIVEGITSVSPNMTLLTDTEGVIINCEYYNYINLLSKEKYKEGHTEGYETGYNSGYEQGNTDGYQSGWSVGYENGKTDGYGGGYNDGYEAGFPDGYNDGVNIGYNDGFSVGKEEGIVEGKQAEYDAFWDIFQNYGNRTDYNYAFGFGFTNANFYPKYDIIVKNYCTSIFYALAGGSKFSLIDRLNSCGVKLDTSKAINLTGLFNYANRITGIPTIDCTGLSGNSTSLFANLYANCKTIEKIITKESVTYKNWFTNTDVTNVTFEGVIGQDLDISYGDNLTVASMNSIISCLKDITTETDTTRTLTLGTAKKAKLTEAEIAVATQKGWSVA